MTTEAVRSPALPARVFLASLSHQYNVIAERALDEEAATVFEDVDLLVNVDPVDRSRFIAVGFSSVARVLVVVHVVRSEHTRLISARRATSNEERLYVDRRGE